MKVEAEEKGEGRGRRRRKITPSGPAGCGVKGEAPPRAGHPRRRGAPRDSGNSSCRLGRGKQRETGPPSATGHQAGRAGLWQQRAKIDCPHCPLPPTPGISRRQHFFPQKTLSPTARRFRIRLSLLQRASHGIYFSFPKQHDLKMALGRSQASFEPVKCLAGKIRRIS